VTFVSRSPDYNVTALDKDSDERARIGAAWNNPDGSISIRLNHFITLRSTSSLLIALWPVDKKPPTKKGRST